MRIPIRTVGVAALAIVVTHEPVRAQESALQSAIRSFGPDMSLPDEATLVVRDDFNGDGHEDVAAVVRGPDRSALVVFHGTTQGYEMHPLYTRLPQGDVQLRVVPSGRQAVVGNASGVQLAHPGIELIFPGRSSAMYVWESGRYQVYGTESFYAR